MSLPPISPLEHLADRSFSFYPPIVNIEHNEWFFRRGTWSEILVVNSRSGTEVWIPRRFVGEVSQIEDPVVIVGLVKELEYKAGAVWPHQRRLIEMPLAVGERPRTPVAAGTLPAPVIGIRTTSVTDSRIGKLVGFTLLAGVVASFVTVHFFFPPGVLRPRAADGTTDQLYVQLTHDDDYYSVVRKLGLPSKDQRSESGTIHFRSLAYSQGAYTVILMGDAPNSVRYIGTVDQRWKPIHWVAQRTGGDTQAVLRAVKRF